VPAERASAPAVELLAGAAALEAAVPLLPLVCAGLCDIYSAYGLTDTIELRQRVHALVQRCLAEVEGLLAIGRVAGAPVGFLLIGRRYNEITAASYPFLHAIWVHPQARRHAVADALLTAASRHLRASGFWRLVAQVNHQNPFLEAFLGRYDFAHNSLIIVRAL
jgi:L-amino acid N-acyltransferase YncA